jgi:hypothetical protein
MALVKYSPESNFDYRKSEISDLGVQTLDELRRTIQDYERRGFHFEAKESGETLGDIWGAHTPLGGYITYNEAQMILAHPITGHTRHIEACNALSYIRLKEFSNQISLQDDYNPHEPSKTCV